MISLLHHSRGGQDVGEKGWTSKLLVVEEEGKTCRRDCAHLGEGLSFFWSTLQVLICHEEEMCKALHLLCDTFCPSRHLASHVAPSQSAQGNLNIVLIGQRTSAPGTLER